MSSRATSAARPHIGTTMKPLFGRKSLDPNVQPKVIGCEKYYIPSSEAVERMDVAEIKALFALANQHLVAWIQAYLD